MMEKLYYEKNLDSHVRSSSTDRVVVYIAHVVLLYFLNLWFSKKSLHTSLLPYLFSSATVLEEPELEADMVGEDQDQDQGHNQDKAKTQDGEDGEAEESTEATHDPVKRGWVRRSVASSGTHHSTELIEVQVPDHPAITMDCCVQVKHY